MSLEEATEALYAAFSQHPLREHVAACPCCVTEAHRETLAHTPLRALRVDQLSSYAWHALLTPGGTPDYKHFLPRILELATTVEAQGMLGFDLDSIVRRLELAEWSEWPTIERDAVSAHLRAFWRSVLGADPAGGWSAYDELRSLQDVFGLKELLDEWGAHDSLGAALQLAAFVDDLRYGLPDAELWGDEGARTVERWLRDPARKATLEAAFERHLNEPVAERLARAIDVYGWSFESDLGHDRAR